jgi:hypothetical protein
MVAGKEAIRKGRDMKKEVILVKKSPHCVYVMKNFVGSRNVLKGWLIGDKGEYKKQELFKDIEKYINEYDAWPNEEKEEFIKSVAEAYELFGEKSEALKYYDMIKKKY